MITPAADHAERPFVGVRGTMTLLKGEGKQRHWRLEACLSLQCTSTKDEEAPVPLSL